MQSPAIHLLATRFKDRAGSVNAGLRAGGKGKSGGYRVITAYFGMDVPVYLIAMLSKGERSNFSRAEIAGFKMMTDEIARHWRRRRR